MLSKLVTLEDLTDKEKTNLLENRILYWAEIAQILVQSLPPNNLPEVLVEISQASTGAKIEPHILKTLKEKLKSLDAQNLIKIMNSWDMTAHFLVVTLGNIVKNLKAMPKGCSSEIKKAGNNLKAKYNGQQVRVT